jgi:hypothetical protein
MNGLKNLKTVGKNLYLNKNNIVHELDTLRIVKSYLYVYVTDGSLSGQETELLDLNETNLYFIDKKMITPLYLSTNNLLFENRPVDEANMEPIEINNISLSKNQDKRYSIYSKKDTESIPITLTILHKNDKITTVTKNSKLFNLYVNLSELDINDEIIIKAKGIAIMKTVMKK